MLGKLIFSVMKVCWSNWLVLLNKRRSRKTKEIHLSDHIDRCICSTLHLCRHGDVWHDNFRTEQWWNTFKLVYLLTSHSFKGALVLPVVTQLQWPWPLVKFTEFPGVKITTPPRTSGLIIMKLTIVSKHIVAISLCCFQISKVCISRRSYSLAVSSMWNQTFF